MTLPFNKITFVKSKSAKMKTITLSILLWIIAFGAMAQVPSSGNVLWLKADAGVYNDAGTTLATNGQTLQQWNDQSGSNNHASQATSSLKPTFVTNVLNGNPVVRFGSSMLVTPNIDLSGIDKVDMYVVYKSTNLSGTWECIVEEGPDYNSVKGFTFFDNAQTLTYSGMYVGHSGNNFNAKNYPFKANTFKVVNSSFDRSATVANEINLRINGVDCPLFNQNFANDNSGNYNNVPLYIGNRGNAVNSYPLNGDIAEIILYNRLLTPAEKQAVETYLNNKYNIQCGVTTPQPGSGNCLQMGSYGAFAQDGADIDFGSNDFTIEFWTMKRALSSGGTNSACVNKWNSGGSPGTNEWAVATTTDGNNNIPAFYFETGSTYYQANATTSLTTNKWYHIAAAREGNNIKIYVNGILEGTTAIPAGCSVNNVAQRTFMALGYYPWGGSNNSNLDELRIWKTALSQTTIRDWMCKKETASHPNHANLARYYRFDETSGTIFGNQVNSCVTEAYSNGGTLVTSGAPIGDVSAYDYTPNTGTANVNFGTPTDNISATMNAGTSAGVHVYGVNEFPNNQNYPGLAGNNKYGGVFVVNGNATAAYNTTYNYTNNTAVNTSNEPTLKLFKRSDNAANLWAQATNQTLNTTAKTITATGQNTEYILGAAITPVPPNCYGSFPNAGDLLNRIDNSASVSLLDQTVDNFTYEIWANPTHALGAGSTSGDRYLIWPEQVTQYGKSGYGVGIAVGTNGIRVYAHAAGTLSAFLSYSTTINSWTHIALTCDAGHNAVLYVNGLSVASTSGISTVRANDGFMFTNYYGQYFGQAADFRLWNYARSATEIMNGMNTPPANNATGLLTQFSLNNLYNGSGQLIKNTFTNTPTLNLDKITAGTAITPAFNCTGQNFPPLTQPSCAIKFDGAGSYVNVTNSPTTMPNKGTIEFWMNQPSFSDWQIPLSTFSPTATSATFTDGMYFQTYANGNLYFIYASSYTVYGIELIGTLSPNKNYHVALSWDLTAQKIKGYLDGRLIFVRALTTTFPTSIPKITLGGGFANGRYYNGTLDEVRYWNTERTQSEIVNTASNTLAGNETGLVAYYNFNDNTVGGNGQTVTNGCSATGATLNGTTVSTTAFPRFPCSFNTPSCGISFNGTSDRVTVPYNASLSLTQFTVAAWIKTSSTATYQTVVGKQYDATNQNYTLYVHDGKAEITFQHSPIVTGGGQVSTGTSIVNDGQWHYLAGTFDGSNLKIYVDGVLENTLATTYTPLTSTFPFAIGAWPAGGNPLSGSVDELSVWNTALPASQIFSNMNSSLSGNETNLVAYYNFNDNNRSGQNRSVTNLCTATGSAIAGTTVGSQTTPVFPCAPPPFTNPECNMVLDGINDNVVAPNSSLINLNTFSIGTYFKTTSSSAYKTILYKDANGSMPNYQLAINTLHKAQVLMTSSTTSLIVATGTSIVDDNLWHYMVATFDGSFLKLYVDGNLEATTTITTPPLTLLTGAGSLYIGSNKNGTEKFAGSLDEISIWNTALSLTQIQGMIGQRLLGNESGLVAYYNFVNNSKDGQGQTIYNSATTTGAALNGTAFGTTATPKFTCSEIPVAAPPCSMQMNGLVDAAYPDTYPYGNVNNNFTMEVIARPAFSKGDAGDGLVFSPPGSYLQNGQATHQTYLILPANYGIPGHASVGISLGTNGIAVYEGSASYMPGRIVLNNYPVNDWVHLTVVSENGLLKLYVNGSLKGTAAPSGYILNPSAFISNPVANGVAFHGFFGFAGNVSEYRVWNASLSADQIRTNINANLTGSETNLISLYKLTGNAENNTGGRNLTITGLGSVGSANPLKTAGTSCSPVFACASNNNISRDWKPGSGGMFVGTTSTYLHYADLGNWGNAPTQGSIMLWFNPVAMQENGTVLNTTQFRGANGGLVNAFKLYSTADGKMNLSIGKDTSVAGYKDVATVLSSTPTNKWYHFALTWNTTTKAYTVYINGLQVTSGTSNFLPTKFDAVKAGIGHTFGTSTAWNGYIDEISVWDKILSQTEIKDQLTAKINSAQSNYSNVLHYYRFDNDDCGYFGTSGGGQSNTITDYKGNAHGMKFLYWIQWQYYNNFGFPTSSAPIGSYSSYQYNGSTSATTLNIGNGGATSNADVVTATLTSGTADGIHVYGEDVWPNTLNGVNDTVPGSHRYAGVFVVNPNAAQYTLKYNYAGNPNVTTAIEPYLKLFKRDNNAVTIWAQATNVTQDATNHFLEATGQNTEYILAKIANTLPLQMLSFTAQKQENHAILKWRTAQMQNVSGFEIQRSPDGVTFTKIGFVAASSLDQYMFDDLLSGNGKYFYRIKIIDNDDKYMYSDIRLIIVSEKIEVAIFPNPVKSLLSITASKNIRKCRVINATGTEVFKTSITSNQTLINMAALSAGLYVVEISFVDETVTQKIIKQ